MMTSIKKAPLVKEENIRRWAETLELATIAAETMDNFVDKHFGLHEEMIVSNSDLIYRLEGKTLNGQRRYGSVDYASAFTRSRADIMDAVRTFLSDSYTVRAIARWANDFADGKDLNLDLEIEEDLPAFGKIFCREPWHDWNAGPGQCHCIRVVLRKDEDSVKYNSDRNFYILTMYPKMTLEDKENCKQASLAWRQAHPRQKRA